MNMFGDLLINQLDFFIALIVLAFIQMVEPLTCAICDLLKEHQKSLVSSYGCTTALWNNKS